MTQMFETELGKQSGYTLVTTDSEGNEVSLAMAESEDE